MDEGPELLRTPRFEYSPENPPPLEVLESKLFAVHATPIFPENGVVKAGAQDISYGQRWEGEPPAFRPTIHFSLGELVRGHGDFSWDEHSFGVVVPIKTLENQLVNISPHDTFILGDLKLTLDCVLLVPKGTDVSRLPPEVKFLEYDPQVGLRSAIDKLIQERGGWHIQMRQEGGHIGSTIFIDDVEINSPDFFRPLLEKYPNLSYGSHVRSEEGDAFRFGLIDQAVSWAMAAYRGWPSSSNRLKFLRALIIHNFQRLDSSLETSAFPQDSLDTFLEKGHRLFDWINILDADLEIREKWGRSLYGAPEGVLKEAFQKRGDPESLKRFLEDSTPTLTPTAYERNDLTPLILAAYFAPMTPQEVDEFITRNRALFKPDILSTLYAHYTVSRWLIINNETAKHEGLDQILASSLEEIESQITNGKKPDEEMDIFNNLEDFLTVESSRLSTALSILRHPKVKKYLSDYYQFTFTSDGPVTLEDVLRAHPQTKLIFELPQVSLGSEEQLALEFLKKVGYNYQLTVDRKEALKSFSRANSLSLGFRLSTRRMQKYLDDIKKPINSAKPLGEMLVGDELSLYQALRRDNKNAGDLWKALGLEKEFRHHFPDEEQFWKSDLSLWEIYKTLRAAQELK